MSKYKNKKVQYEGEWFDSKGELQRWLNLKFLEKQGYIIRLKRQVSIDLILPFDAYAYDKDLGRTIRKFQGIKYIADFVYVEIRNDHGVYWKEPFTVIEDFKGMKTALYQLKKKLLIKEYGSRYVFKETSSKDLF